MAGGNLSLQRERPEAISYLNIVDVLGKLSRKAEEDHERQGMPIERNDWLRAKNRESIQSVNV